MLTNSAGCGALSGVGTIFLPVALLRCSVLFSNLGLHNHAYDKKYISAILQFLCVNSK